MNVTMCSQGQYGVFVANGDAFIRRDFPDASQAQFRELFFPCIQQFHRVAARNREQQFKILAIGERGDERQFRERDFCALFPLPRG